MNAITDPLCRELQETACRIRNRVSHTAYEVGRELATAKGKCKHGQWLPFLEAAGIGERSAQKLMQYSRAIDADPTINPGQALPSMRSVLGANPNRGSYLVNDATDDKLEDEADQREIGW